MYSVTIVNSTGAPMTTADGHTIQPNETWVSSDRLGNTFVHSEEFGSISFRDLAQERIGGDSDETWGVLISYRGDHMVGRYEGGGKLKVSFDKYLRATLSGMHLRQVRVESLVAGN